LQNAFFTKEEKSLVANIKLPKPDYRGIVLEVAIEKRRSIRNFSKRPIPLYHLSQLLFSAQGLTGNIYGQTLRSAPSAGALYPMEIYIVVNNVDDLSTGIYRYKVIDHSLDLLRTGDFRKELIDAGWGQGMLGDSCVTFILSAVFERIVKRYGERGYRYIYMEAGHISQNLYLQAVSLGHGSVCVGAFSDERVNRLIGIDGKKESAIYIHAVGTI
jgi:SagB-type dehydrogenase family enzyme